jgi:hypothetical protein
LDGQEAGHDAERQQRNSGRCRPHVLTTGFQANLRAATPSTGITLLPSAAIVTRSPLLRTQAIRDPSGDQEG